jgi:hypothetical protein
MELEKVIEYSLWDTDSGTKVVSIEESLENDSDYFLRLEADQFTKEDIICVANFILASVNKKGK